MIIEMQFSRKYIVTWFISDWWIIGIIGFGSMYAWLKFLISIDPRQKKLNSKNKDIDSQNKKKKKNSYFAKFKREQKVRELSTLVIMSFSNYWRGGDFDLTQICKFLAEGPLVNLDDELLEELIIAKFKEEIAARGHQNNVLFRTKDAICKLAFENRDIVKAYGIRLFKDRFKITIHDMSAVVINSVKVVKIGIGTSSAGYFALSTFSPLNPAFLLSISILIGGRALAVTKNYMGYMPLGAPVSRGEENVFRTLSGLYSRRRKTVVNIVDYEQVNNDRITMSQSKFNQKYPLLDKVPIKEDQVIQLKDVALGGIKKTKDEKPLIFGDRRQLPAKKGPQVESMRKYLRDNKPILENDGWDCIDNEFAKKNKKLTDKLDNNMMFE